MDIPTAEKLSREAWFSFELEPVVQKYNGDWVAFYFDKKKTEDALKAEWEKHGERMLPGGTIISSYDEVRAMRLLEEEFNLVVLKQENKAIALAQSILSELRRGNYEAVAKDCVMYGATAPDRLAWTLQYLKTQKNELSELVAEFDRGKAKFSGVHLSGSPAKAEIRIGFEGYAIELWWSGPVMPEASGPLRAKPQTNMEAEGHWQFHKIITPCTPAPLPLQ